jgi:hypothetical protein
MPRTLSRGEKPFDWVGSSKRDFLTFPEAVKDAMGNALGVAQFGGKHPSAKPWKGQGPGVFEVVEDHDGDTARSTRSASGRSCMCCTPSRRSRPAASGQRSPTSTWLRDV